MKHSKSIKINVRFEDLSNGNLIIEGCEITGDYPITFNSSPIVCDLLGLIGKTCLNVINVNSVQAGSEVGSAVDDEKKPTGSLTKEQRVINRLQAELKRCKEKLNKYEPDYDVKDIPEKLIDDLKKLHGLPPYDSWSNVCRGDAYFAKSIDDKYGKRLVDAAIRLVLNPMKGDLNKARNEVVSKWTRKLD